MVRPERFELPTPWFVAKCSIQLSYGRIEIILAKTNSLVLTRRSNCKTQKKEASPCGLACAQRARCVAPTR
jgi:hypothetical protein